MKVRRQDEGKILPKTNIARVTNMLSKKIDGQIQHVFWETQLNISTL